MILTLILSYVAAEVVWDLRGSHISGCHVISLPSSSLSLLFRRGEAGEKEGGPATAAGGGGRSGEARRQPRGAPWRPKMGPGRRQQGGNGRAADGGGWRRCGRGGWPGGRVGLAGGDVDAAEVDADAVGVGPVVEAVQEERHGVAGSSGAGGRGGRRPWR